MANEDDRDFLENWTEDQLEARLLISDRVGAAAAMESLAEKFKTKAGEMFQNGRDDLAKFLRDEMVSFVREEGRRFRKEQHEFQEDYDRKQRSGEYAD